MRKALRYRSQGITHSVVLSRETLRHVFDLVRSPEFKALQTERRKSPIQRNSDTWYISGHGRPALIYSDVDKDEPPREIVDWFHEVESLPAVDAWESAASKEVCLGFCYDSAWR